MTKKKTWSQMDSDEREAAVRQLMAAGGSNTSVAGELDTTPGAIAGIRFKKGIPSTNKARGMGKPKAGAKPKQEKAPASNVPGLMEAKSEASRCEYKRSHCPYEAKVSSVFCLLHQESETPARRS